MSAGVYVCVCERERERVGGDVLSVVTLSLSQRLLDGVHFELRLMYGLYTSLLIFGSATDPCLAERIY